MLKQHFMVIIFTQAHYKQFVPKFGEWHFELCNVGQTCQLQHFRKWPSLQRWYQKKKIWLELNFYYSSNSSYIYVASKNNSYTCMTDKQYSDIFFLLFLQGHGHPTLIFNCFNVEQGKIIIKNDTSFCELRVLLPVVQNSFIM